MSHIYNDTHNIDVTCIILLVTHHSVVYITRFIHRKNMLTKVR